MGRVWIFCGCVMAGLSVILGAFGAHALKDILPPEKMTILATANHYLGYHALALLALGLWNHWEKWSTTFLTGLCFVLGSLFFAGSLYALALTPYKAVAFLTPVGGLLFIIGWTLFALSVLKAKSSLI